jgi:hypothetical protein
MMIWLLGALIAYAAPIPPALQILDGHPPPPKGAACDGVVEADGISHYRVACATVMSFAPRSACYKADDRYKGWKWPCIDTWDALGPSGSFTYHHAFGPLRAVAGRDGLYLADDWLLRVSDAKAAEAWGPFLDEDALAREAATFGPLLDPPDFPAAYGLVKDRPGFRDAMLTELRRRLRDQPTGDLPFHDFYEHGRTAVMFWYWEDDKAYPNDAPLIAAMKRQVVNMDYLYTSHLGGDAYKSEGKGYFASYLRWARGYTLLGPRDRLRVHGFGTWPSIARDLGHPYAERILARRPERVRAALARDLRTVARDEYARGRPAVAAVLEAMIATIAPIRVTGQQAELITTCDREEGSFLVWLGRYGFAKSVFDPSLPVATFHIDDPVMRSRVTTETEWDTVERVVAPAQDPPADVRLEVRRIHEEIEQINQAIESWSAWAGARGSADASVTGWSCRESTGRCAATWQGGGSNSFGAIVEANGRRQIASLEARRDALYARIAKLLPPGSYAPPVVATDVIRRDITTQETSFDGTFVMSYRGVVRQFRASSSWRDTAYEARAESVCEAAEAAAAGLDDFFLEILAEAARSAAPGPASDDPVEQAVRAWPERITGAHVDALLRAVIGP